MTYEEIKFYIDSSNSMAEASRNANMNFSTFRYYAEKYNLYKPNQGYKGGSKPKKYAKYPLDEILEGKHPNYNTYRLKKKLIKMGILEDKCYKCGWAMKRYEEDEFTTCELHHIDGNPTNHILSNLIILCPNCHSLTETFRGKNIK